MVLTPKSQKRGSSSPLQNQLSKKTPELASTENLANKSNTPSKPKSTSELQSVFFEKRSDTTQKQKRP